MKWDRRRHEGSATGGGRMGIEHAGQPLFVKRRIFDPQPPLRGTFSPRERDNLEACPFPAGRGCREVAAEGRRAPASLSTALYSAVPNTSRALKQRGQNC